MGVTSSSPHRVTLERGNQDIGVIKITPSALHQLTRTNQVDDEESRPEIERQDISIPTELPSDRQNQDEKGLNGDKSGYVGEGQTQGPSNIDWRLLQSFQQWQTEEQQEKEEDFKRLEAEYKEHFNEIEQLLSESQKKAEQEASLAADTVISKLKKPRRYLLVEHADLMSRLSNCLEKNKDRPLLCSELAKEFAAVASAAHKKAAVS